MGQSAFRRVLVPLEFGTDVSDAADGTDPIEIVPGQPVVIVSASVDALRLAETLGASHIDLIHATPDLARAAIYGGVDGGMLPGPHVSDLEALSKRRAIAVLETLAKRHLGVDSVECHAAPGRAADVILGAAEELKSDAIVLAVSTRGRLRRFAVGSTVNRVIRRATCPVLVVPAQGA